MSSKKHIAVIGAGYSGLAAGFDLAKKGHKVTIFESDREPGGLAGTFEINPGHRVEKFYHHWFTSDRDVIDFVGELGLSGDLKYLPSTNGLFFANTIFRLASPLDLLRFDPLPLVDRIRTGLMALHARRIRDWKSLEGVSAEEWITRVGGRRSYETIWRPLLGGKFGPEAPNVSAVWFWNKLKLRGSSRDNKGRESLVYFEGGFSRLTEAMTGALERAGGKIELATPVKRVRIADSTASGVETENGFVEADYVLSTVPLPVFLDMTPELPEDYVARSRRIRFLGNVCLVLRLRHSLSSTYWLNVADPSFPFVGIIEHTNFDAIENYGGEHIAYLSKYLPTSEPMYSMSEDELFDFSLPHIQRMFPAFDRDWVIGYKAWRAPYSQPVITKHYSSLIPPARTPIERLWLCTMAQVYPEDRGTNYAVRWGRRTAAEMLSDIESR